MTTKWTFELRNAKQAALISCHFSPSRESSFVLWQQNPNHKQEKFPKMEAALRRRISDREKNSDTRNRLKVDNT